MEQTAERMQRDGDALNLIDEIARGSELPQEVRRPEPDQRRERQTAPPRTRVREHRGLRRGAVHRGNPSTGRYEWR